MSSTWTLMLTTSRRIPAARCAQPSRPRRPADSGQFSEPNTTALAQSLEGNLVHGQKIVPPSHEHCSAGGLCRFGRSALSEWSWACRSCQRGFPDVLIAHQIGRVTRPGTEMRTPRGTRCRRPFSSWQKPRSHRIHQSRLILRPCRHPSGCYVTRATVIEHRASRTVPPSPGGGWRETARCGFAISWLTLARPE